MQFVGETHAVTQFTEDDVEWGASTVAIAYGENRARRSATSAAIEASPIAAAWVPWMSGDRPADDDAGRWPRVSDDSVASIAIEARAIAPRRENARVARFARVTLAGAATIAVVTLAALGGYTFVKRGMMSTQQLPPPAAATVPPVPESVDDAAAKDSDTQPQTPVDTLATPRLSAPEPSAPETHESATVPSDAAPADGTNSAPAETTAPAPAVPNDAQRRSGEKAGDSTATKRDKSRGPPKTLRDAAETDRIIARELVGVPPRPPR